MSAITDRITIQQTNERWSEMTYTVKLETFNGAVKNITLPSKGAVAQFINTYPNQLPVGISVKLDCDALGIRGTLRGKALA
jgi:plastocyanin domain-containing protein